MEYNTRKNKAHSGYARLKKEIFVSATFNKAIFLTSQMKKY